MTVLTISSKGQITLKRDLLQHLGIQAGQRITIDKLPNGTLNIQAEQNTGKIDDFIGKFAGRLAQPISLDEMNAITEQAWAGEKCE
ncbi:AbrB/MazE/SpoVT family DNA-binding domain-containing protein [Wielerella bovis]|uniref:AbrB/MazE/SpoVT family DNA-binding domain-containing protein n=1 Tax=Wielerella bovis TaxID=2917790 RepID=UPI002019A3AA|nr:AbrB/MazE/SpoVT family DNA-binding domain-containing protein [Wielerella bovis]ULJ64738.1 AbrB/MazE/SpoVT family DNA-binding domain-containing protein [Wielerella bovis]ULJ67010.1 AbrB/MazE/SpoVT family DNA-binding domain-containing protein [Wielerella bovis]ULJ69234.1 AbrB/MazE/SpoVT family DNA-binding domain-containing protein [Wielerella bovis]